MNVARVGETLLDAGTGRRPLTELQRNGLRQASFKCGDMAGQREKAKGDQRRQECQRKERPLPSAAHVVIRCSSRERRTTFASAGRAPDCHALTLAPTTKGPSAVRTASASNCVAGA